MNCAPDMYTGAGIAMFYAVLVFKHIWYGSISPCTENNAKPITNFLLDRALRHSALAHDFDSMRPKISRLY